MISIQSSEYADRNGPNDTRAKTFDVTIGNGLRAIKKERAVYGDRTARYEPPVAVKPPQKPPVAPPKPASPVVIKIPASPKGA